MALSFSDITTETLARLRLDSNSTTLANGWVNQTIQDLHSRHDWFWTLDRAIVQTVVDKTAGTVSVSASGTSVNGSSTEFDSGDIGSFIQFQDSNDWSKRSHCRCHGGLYAPVPPCENYDLGADLLLYSIL